MTNIAWSKKLLLELAVQGVNEIVLCAGARNSPLVALLSQAGGLKVHSFFEERSAGFFAIGRMQADGQPVAVCTTSGTAVAELLPAVVEAHYQSLPLIVISADRPKTYRGSGAPQTIVQPGIFSSYVEREWDLEPSAQVPEIQLGRQPLHINVCFDEPLIDDRIEKWNMPYGSAQPGPVANVARVEITAKNPLVIAGRLNRWDAESFLPTLQRWGRPVYAEALSHLRGVKALREIEIQGGEDSVAAKNFDGVIRIGDVPTLRFWRDLEKNGLRVWHFSAARFSGLPRQQEVWPLAAVEAAVTSFEPWSEAERISDRARFEKIESLLHEFPLSEQAWVKRVSEWVPEHSRILLGNSLPIREWDLAAGRGRKFSFYGNRGTNGIDGLISTFLGVASFDVSNWALIGDLSALYDLAGPWALRGRAIQDINLAVINNGGGKIFERIFKNKMFENPHQLDFKNWAAMWGWNYQRLQKADESPKAENGPRVLEIVPDPLQTQLFCEALEKFKC